MSIKNGKKVLLIPVGVTVEAARGLLSYTGPGSAVIGVFLDDGKFMDAKRNVLNALKIACDAVGADFFECGVTFQDGFARLIKILRDIGSSEVYLGTTTGPRFLSILLIKALYEYAASYNVGVYLIVGVEGEPPISIININGLFTSLADLGRLQRRALTYLAEKGEAGVDEVARAVGASKWTFYKTLSSLIEGGFVEKVKRGSYRLTLIGRILAELEEALSHELP